MNAGLWSALVILLAAASLTTVRAVQRGGIGDRAVAFDMLAAIIASGLLVGATASGDGLLLDIALVIGLLGFLTSVTVARFIERRGE